MSLKSDESAGKTGTLESGKARARDRRDTSQQRCPALHVPGPRSRPFARHFTCQDSMAARHEVPGLRPVPDTKCRDSNTRRNRSCRRGSPRMSAALTRAGRTPKRDFLACLNTLSRPAPTGHGLARCQRSTRRKRELFQLRLGLPKIAPPDARRCRAPTQALAETFTVTLMATGLGLNGDSGNGSGSKSSQKSA